MSADARNLESEPFSASTSQLRALSERVPVLEAELAHARAVEAHASALVESERRFRRIVESSAEGVWTLDAGGFTSFVNSAMASLLGYRAEQLLGRQALDFVVREWVPIAREKLEERRRGVHELPLRHSSGKEIWAVLTLSPFEDEQGRFSGQLAMVSDATEKRRAERERTELSERMVEGQRLESLGVLAGGIAHDFNNLLAAIMGHVEIAFQDTTLTLRSRTALSNALAAAQRAAGLTRQLLDYSGRSEVALSPLRLGSHTAEIIELLRASIPKRVSIELAVDDAGLAMLGDPDRLQQATMNLVLNAAEAYGSNPGTIHVRVGREDVSGALPGLRTLEPVKPGDYVYLEVQDRGIGMDEATLKRVFEPFFTTKTRGRGLGLAATLGIVRTHGGHLTVHSKPNSGTTFRAYFPRTEELPACETPVPAALAQPPARPRTLLVVDDEPMVREFAQRMLEAEGYHVLEAATGRAALELLRARLAEIDGVLLDLSMPGMDGDALLSELRSFAPTLPVIVHSGHSLETTSERLAEWGIAGVLQKPYRAAKLSAMVRSLFGDSPSERPGL